MAIAASDTYKPLGAADATVDLAVGGYGTVGIQVAGTWAGTITFEGTVDTGTWQTLSATLTNSTTRVITTTGNGIWTASVAGLRKVRARMSVYTSGTANVQLLVVGVGGGSSGGGGGVGSDVNLIEVGGAAIALGETTMAASVPVVIASNQTAIPITGSISATNPSVGPTADPVPAEATFIGADDGTGDLAGLALAKLDYATDGSTVPQSAMGLALPSTTGPVAAIGGAGAVSSQVQRTTLASDDPAVVALQIIDDWDESDRAKVNLIVGQAGIAGGTGADGATVPRVTLATNVGLPAGTSLLGRVSGSDETSTIYNGTTALTPKFAIIAESSSGGNEVVAAVTAKKIRVLNYTLISNGTVNAKWQSASTDISGLLYLIANVGASPAYAPTGHFETASGEALNLNLSGAVAVGGHLSYIEV